MMSEVVITDSTVLIYLARLGNLDYLNRLFDDVQISKTVYEEAVTRGEKEEYADALPIKEATNRFIDTQALSKETEMRADEIQKSSGIDRGECTAIALAEKEDARCLTDDHAARQTAKSLGIDIGGTIYVLLEALDKGRISFEEYVNELDNLTDNGFRMSANLYRRAIEEGEDLTD